MAWTKANTAVAASVVALLAAGISIMVRNGDSRHSMVANAQADATVLQGTWTGQENNGAAGSSTLTIVGSNLEFRGANPNEWYKATFSLREDTTPKQLITVVTDCPAPQYRGKTSYGIYQIQGGTLTLVAHEPGKPAPPTSFNACDSRKFAFTKH